MQKDKKLEIVYNNIIKNKIINKKDSDISLK